MLANLRAQNVQAFSAYKSADGTNGVTNSTGGLIFKNGLYVGGTVSAVSTSLAPDSVTIMGTGGLGYILFSAQTAAPSLGGAHIYATSAGRIALGHSGTTAYNIIFANDSLTATRTLTVQDKNAVIAAVGDNISEFTNDSGYVAGPSSAVSGRLPSFNGVTGKLIQDSGINIAGTSGKTLTLTGALTIGADTTVTGGGTVALGGFTFTVPATGTGVITTRTLTAGAGLIGAGDLSADRTFDVGAGLGITVNANDVALTTPGTLTVSTSNAATGNHTHAITSSANPGAAASLLASDSSGFLRLVRLGIGGAPTQPLEVVGNAYINTATANLYMKDTSTGLQVSATGIINPQSGNAFRTTGFTSGVNGWNVSNAGDAEFNNVRVRGELAASVFKISEISATAGTFGVFYSAAALYADCTTGSALYPTTGNAFILSAKNSDAGGMLFAVNDVIRLKSWTGAGISDSWAVVQGRTNNGNNTSYACALVSGSTSATFSAGTAVVDYGPSGTGFITLSTDGTVGSSPNMTMATHAGAPYSAFTTLLRLGNLNGSYGYATDVYGLGVGQYGTASKSWLTIDQTSGIRIGNNTTILGQWDSSGDATFGQTGSSKTNVYITGGSVQIRDNTTAIALFNTGGLSFDASNSSARAITWGTALGSANNVGVVGTQYGSNNTSFYISAVTPFGVTTGLANAEIAAKNDDWGGSGTASYIQPWARGTAAASNPNTSYTSIYGIPAANYLGTTIGSVNLPTHMLDVYGTGWFQDKVTIVSTGNDPLTILASGAATGTRIGSYFSNTNSAGQTTMYVENNRGTFASYGGILYGGSTNAIGNLFGVSRADRMFLFADGASNSGMVVGTLASASLILGTNNTAGITLSTAQAVRFHAYGAGTLTTDASGNITASSDERLKVIKGEFRKGLDAVRNLRAIRYRWRKDSGLDRSQEYVGFGARHTRRHIPEAIGKGKDGFHTMSDRVILATVVNAIKELENKYESLSRAIAA